MKEILYTKLMAEFEGWKYISDGNCFVKNEDIKPYKYFQYQTDYNQLMAVWVKFRDMKKPKFFHKIQNDLGIIILYSSISESFNELGETINMLKVFGK